MSEPFEQQALEIQRQQAQEDINRCFSSLVGKQDRRSVPEDIFVTHFLPFFSGQRNFKEDPNIIPTWATIAGTPFAEVNVVNQQGEVQVVVPGLMPTLQSNLVEKHVGTDLNRIVNQADTMGSQLSVIGKRFLTQQLDEKTRQLAEAVIPEAVSPIAEQWDAIFKKYNVAPKETEAKQNVPQEKPIDDDVDYV